MVVVVVTDLKQLSNSLTAHQHTIGYFRLMAVLPREPGSVSSPSGPPSSSISEEYYCGLLEKGSLLDSCSSCQLTECINTLKEAQSTGLTSDHF